MRRFWKVGSDIARGLALLGEIGFSFPLSWVLNAEILTPIDFLWFL